MSDEIEVRPEVMEMLQYIVNADLPGAKIKEELIPTSTEMSEFPDLTLHHGKTSYRQITAGWYVINHKKLGY